jgi:hypothetical protein
MYSLYLTKRYKLFYVKSVNTLKAALEYAEVHKDEGWWGIKYPDGSWHRW